MPGINKYNEKDRRRQRRQNVVAKDLASGKYYQRVINGRKRIDNEDRDDYFFVEEDEECIP